MTPDNLNMARERRVMPEFLERYAETGGRDFCEGDPPYRVRPHCKSNITAPLTC